MKYKDMEPAFFLERPNRFIAFVETGAGKEVCHVKNTGRCKELLSPRAQVYVQRNHDPKRKTPLDLITVLKGERLINMDSQVPNQVAKEWVLSSGFVSQDAMIKPEKKFRDSRFDLYMEDGNRKIFMEVKGCTLEEEGVCRFPDAPTVRGSKHVKELIEAKKAGYEAYILFVIQMENVKYIRPNERTDPDFCKALWEAYQAGVGVLAIDCHIEIDEIIAGKPVKVVLDEIA